MIFYYCEGNFLKTLKEAKELARFCANDSYDDIPVSRVEVATDRENVCAMLNHGAGIMRSLEDDIFIAKAKRIRSEE